MIDYCRLMNRVFVPVEQTYSARDAILYALAVGYGADGADARELAFIYDEGLRAAPTLPLVLGSPGFWLDAPDTGIDWVRAVHAEQGIILHAPVKPAGRVVGCTAVTGVVDRGKDKGALLLTERKIYDRDSGALIASLSSSTLCRGDGGFGGSVDRAPVPHRLPETPPQTICDLTTTTRAALLYRLHGDNNPLHVEPAVARAAGFDRPIMHGLATLGVAARAILRMLCDYDTGRFRGIKARFTAPVYPGETIRTEMWPHGRTISFRSRALERNAVVLNNGLAELDPAARNPAPACSGANDLLFDSIG